MTVINFPIKLRVPVKYEKPLPRQRVFYLGFVYTGPQLCQDVMNLYLKRHGKKNGVRKWSLITYGKYDENDKRKYSIEINFCDEDDVPYMLREHSIGDDIKLDDLRSEEISKLASQISQSTEVRKSLVNFQRNFANNPPKGKGSIIDGRDIGTIIIPNAEVKFFIDANVEIRASRRNQQLKLSSFDLSNTIENIRKRDIQDSERDISPLKPAVDSFKIDTSEINEKQVLELALKYIIKKTDFI